jgi:NADPH2:quinone reductase
MNLPLLKNYSIVSVCSDAWADKFPEETTAVDERLMQWVGLGQLRPHVSRVLPLEQTAEAMASVMDRTYRVGWGPMTTSALAPRMIVLARAK